MKSSISLSILIVLCLAFCIARSTNAVVPCGTVDVKATSCIMYATGKDAKPSGACCAGLQQLAHSVKTVNDKKAICRCLKAAIKNFSGVQDKFLSRIPTACNIKDGFRVSINTDCENFAMEPSGGSTYGAIHTYSPIVY
ncbi:non-specific lipid-transfer protein [Striga asiatica]|uniref:Non-specific lipid-transfer protein n=1 Tax=Striga asiatica TaxID=4170 RepID=A0A5A7QUL1_STRAF|nr:non-specific lipid-transfer protein [Striga asiatica]